MASLEQAQERFAKAISDVERALAAMQQRQSQYDAVTQELTRLKASHAALQAEHAGLRKSYDAVLKRQQVATKRLDGTISSLHEVLGA
ncbi:MAG: hypothetical protein Q7N95_16685 [Alphaproteobacteria bacterium]|nr:hypothetical protein [Alphaproteobacteria bacterium]